MKTLRCFVAVPLNSFIRDRVCELQDQLRRSADGRIRWEKPGNLHITIKFLGDVSVSRIDPINGILRDVAAQTPGFGVCAIGLDAFPSARRPRVLYLHVDDPEGRLTAMAGAVDDGLGPLGFPVERRPFVGHVTLGRAGRDSRIGSMEEQLRAVSPSSVGDIEVEELWLMESELTPNGSIYTPLSRAPMVG